MKTTIDLDDGKLRRLMRLTGIKTRKLAIDFELTEAERVARIRRTLGKPFYVDDSGEVVDPRYDLKQLRDEERPDLPGAEKADFCGPSIRRGQP